jgi:LytR cell envelope-related transcriptional attenuator
MTKLPGPHLPGDHRGAAGPPAGATLTLLSAVGTDGLAAAIATKLRRSGYGIAAVGNAPAADWTRSQVRYPRAASPTRRPSPAPWSVAPGWPRTRACPARGDLVATRWEPAVW